ncbi:hypothetical protein C8J56DRAFT_903971 [Mycena floridula]|nr:hypothetical protein C8J56DRAFT_903971 [Mycena floridula]
MASNKPHDAVDQIDEWLAHDFLAAGVHSIDLPVLLPKQVERAAITVPNRGIYEILAQGGECPEIPLPAISVSAFLNLGHPRMPGLAQAERERLAPGRFLNDTLIDFGLNVADLAYNKVKRWTKKVNLFQKRVVLVPINLEDDQHWILALIYEPGNMITPKSAAGGIAKTFIFILDSLRNGQHGEVFTILKDYLMREAERHRYTVTSGSMTNVVPRVDNQHNGWDCGVYLLRFAKAILSGADLRKLIPESAIEPNEFCDGTGVEGIREHLRQNLHLAPWIE